jgi:hypothetical protein
VRQVAAWQFASILGEFVLVLTDWRTSRAAHPTAGAAEVVGEDAAGPGEVAVEEGGEKGRVAILETLEGARRMVHEGFSSISFSPLYSKLHSSTSEVICILRC